MDYSFGGGGNIKLRGKNWHARDHGSIIVRTVGLPPIRENRACLGEVLRKTHAERSLKNTTGSIDGRPIFE